MIVRILVAAVAVAALTACGDEGGSERPVASPHGSAPRGGVPGDGLPTPSLSAGPAKWDQSAEAGDQSSLGSVIAVGPAEVWASGWHHEVDPLILRWTGGRWSQAPLPPGASDHVDLLAASRAGQVWTFASGRAWRWTGGWSSVGGTVGASNNPVDAAAVAGPDAAWAAGGGTRHGKAAFLLHWSGGRWSPVPLPPQAEIHAMDARSPDDVWAVGTTDGRVMTMHWDGDRWTTVPAPPSAAWGSLEKVVAVSANEVWAGGSTGGRTSQAILLRWDGRAWRPQPIPSGISAFTVLAADRHGGVWTSIKPDDRSGDSDVRTPIVHFDGRAWLSETVPGYPPGVWVEDMAWLPDTDRAVAVVDTPDMEEDNMGYAWMRH
ncbi:hypothetical protein GCM10023191_064530 [Actinoallomurus oryzae]|uniref:Photosynthesis system II assembly factor Ycf48/Hcf136-like domain-containing protein n=1 Tax=Actinoallomurus oryzae TaxID=502180 RepID=A0ABP8QR15_9ACTN